MINLFKNKRERWVPKTAAAPTQRKQPEPAEKSPTALTRRNTQKVPKRNTTNTLGLLMTAKQSVTRTIVMSVVCNLEV